MDTDTKLYGVMGSPVGHSLSPFMHNLAFKILSCNGVYLAFEVKNLEDAIAGVKGLGIKGLSVTIPHKEKVIPILDNITKSALEIGAVNTITNNNGILEGDNTDWKGVLASLEEQEDLNGKRILVIGAGGASRSVCYAVKQKECELFITNRTKEKADLLAKEFNGEFVHEKMMTSISPDIIINTTSVGMYPNTKESPVDKKVFKNSSLAMDIVYNPVETRFLREAKMEGLKTVSGIGMFVYQGEAQFRKWTGLNFPVQIMKEKIFNKLMKKE